MSHDFIKGFVLGGAAVLLVEAAVVFTYLFLYGRRWGKS